jgi:hypothetical protein
MHVTRFVSDFCVWADGAGMPQDSRRYLPVAVRRALVEDLPSRDDQERIVTRPLARSRGLKVWHLSETQAFVTGADDQVFGIVRAPLWFGGWNEVAGWDYFIQDSLWHFFFRTANYVARSRMLNGLVAIALTYRLGCDVRYMEMKERTVPVGEAMTPYLASSALLTQGLRANSRSRMLSFWLAQVNALDPWVHRMSFHYVRAMRLFNDNYWEEGITALDSAISVASQFVRDRMKIRSAAPRTALASFAGLSRAQTNQLADLYQLRCFFGAHPAQGGWWDVQDHYAEYVADTLESVERVVREVLVAERSTSIVPPEPATTWSDWFLGCCHVLGPAVWFNFDGPQLLGHGEFLARTGLRGQNGDRKMGPFGSLAERKFPG